MKRGVLLLCCLFSGAIAGRADVRLPSIFSEHMVLQKADATPIWGTAAPGEQVTAAINGLTAQATADADGKWKLTLNLAASPPGPFELTITGKNKIVIPDVLVGQVWLASGQSNMERTMQALAQTDEIAQSANPMLRQFRVERKSAATPQDDCQGTWTVASPTTTGDFSAVGYYFAKKLQASLQQPVALVNVSWGGTVIEAWLSADAIAKDADLTAGAAAVAKQIDDFPAQKAAFVKDFGDWLAARDRADKPCADPANYAGPDISTADWTPLTLPGKIEGANLPSNGAIWIRRELTVPEGAQVQSINGSIGSMNGLETVYWNGQKIEEMTIAKFPGDGTGRPFGIPQSDVHPGKAVIALRIYAPTLPPAIPTDAARFIAGPISLGGPWFAKAEYTLPALTPADLATVPKAPRTPPAMKASFIFNGVVNPVIPYGLAGILWYQGESNAGNAYQYRIELPLLIGDLREKWGQPNLPFYVCQLPNFGLKVTDANAPSPWSEMRESQSLALKLPDTAEAVLVDVGEAQDIHPRDKHPPAERLARIAFNRVYGQKMVDSGPVYQSMTVEGSKIRVKFDTGGSPPAAPPLPKTYAVRMVVHQTAPLVPNSPGSQLEGFAICGADHKWFWAQAAIDGDSVVVSSDKVPQPVAVRYAWADNPTCNLYNADGLPASPFRTDDFPASTQEARFGLPRATTPPTL
jgi:sialate O-acetylesterase